MSALPERPVHRLLAEALRAHGVETLYGLLGDANLYLVEGFVREHGGRFVPTTHEAGAVLAALGHSAVTGAAGVATVTHGPALTNTATALIEGVRGREPAVILAGQVPLKHPDNPQWLEQAQFVAATGAGFVPMRSAESAAEDLALAMRQAQVERRPVVFNMPADLLWQTTRAKPVVRAVPSAAVSAPDGPEMDKAIGIIASARAPVILAGRGAIGARAELAALAQRLGAPLFTTLKAKDLFRTVPEAVGLMGSVMTPTASEVLAAADTLISFGAGLGAYTTLRGSLVSGKRLIQVDKDPAAIAATLAPDAALVGDAAQTALSILRWLDEAEIQNSGFTTGLDLSVFRAPPPHQRLTPKPGTVEFQQALDRLDQLLPENRILVVDGGRFMSEVWTRLSAPDPMSFVTTVNFGSIGLGMGKALGAAAARPDRPTILVVGDGGFMMGGLGEFDSARRAWLDLTVIVCNDSAYGAEHIQLRDKQIDPALSTFNWPDFADLARAFGGVGLTVRRLEELDALPKLLMHSARPILVDLKLDPDAIPRLYLL